MSEAAKTLIQILLVDDHTLFRQGLARLLGAEADFAVAGDCGSIGEGLEILRQQPIDIVLLDFYLGAQNGNDFLNRAKRQGFNGKILLVTVGVSEYEVPALIAGGISGIFLKRDSPLLLGQVIREVVAGGVWFEQRLLQSVVMGIAQDPTAARTERFSERERLVLSYLLEGFTNSKIAEQLSVSTTSIKATLQQLFSKTGVRTRSQLVRIALEQQYKRRL